MKNWTKTACAVFLAALGSAVPPSVAQSVSGQTQTRGVIVLRPTPAASKPTPPIPAPLPVVGQCPRPFARPDLALPSGGSFDRKLAALLRRRPDSVIVDLAVPYVVNEKPPEALMPWIAEIKSSGGAIRISTYCQTNRGLFGNLLRRLFGDGSSSKPYKTADRYDAVLHVNGTDQRVTQIEFAPRSAK